MEYRIGLYNSKIEEGTELESKCDRVYDNIEGVYKHLREGDILVFNSLMTLVGVDSKTLREKIETYNLKIEYKEEIGLKGYTNIFTLNLNLALVDLIKTEREQIKKLLEIL